MEKVEVAFIGTPGMGNLVPTIEFAHRLIERDQRLTATILIINMPHRPIIDTYVDSLTSASTTSAASRIRYVHLPTVDPPSPDQYQSSVAFLSLFIEKHKPHVRHALANNNSSTTAATATTTSALFLNMFCTSMIDVANELNIPSYLYFASPVSFLGFMLYLQTEFDDSNSELTIPGFVNPVPPAVFPDFVLDRKDGDAYYSFLRHAIRYKETKGIIVNTFKELEQHALDSVHSAYGDIIPPIYSVGPVLDLIGPARWHPNRAQHETIMTWLDQQPPSSVVFLTFGSMGSLSGPQVRELAIGLERAGYRFLWSLREPAKVRLHLPDDYTSTSVQSVLPDGFLERTAEIGLVCGWVPQVNILTHKAIGGFVSHCGWNSILESLWYSVPIATWPIYAEQQLNAFKMVKDLNLAIEIRLDYRTGSLIKADEVERGVRLLMDGDNVVRKKVKEMGEKSRNAVAENGSSYTSLGCLIEELTTKISL